MVDRAIIHKFIDDVKRDLDRTNASDFNFDSKLPGYRYVVVGIEEVNIHNYSISLSVMLYNAKSTA